MATGDLTDCTDGALFPQDPCPEDEWIEYRAILSAADLASIGTDFKDFYYDIPGNHDAYNDANFTFYCDYNLRNTNYPNSPTLCQKQLSWTREFSFGNYHFIGVNTAGNDGRGFWDGYWGDYAGLDSEELAFIQNELALEYPNVALTLIFGHHAMDETPGVSGDSWIYYGAPEFASLMETYGVASYGYGHTHEFTEQFFTGGTDYHTGAPYSLSPGIFYININSLGKSSNNHFNITAIDCNGIATVTQAINTWPVVLITAPMDVDLGVADNPYTYNVPNSNTNPIRVLVFDANTPSSVQFRVDGGPWNAMPPTGNSHQYAGVWDASSLSEGYHTIEVQATSSSGTGTDSITTYVEAVGCSTDSECDDSNPCTTDSCVGGNCQYGFEPDTTSCTGTSNGGACDDDANDHCSGTDGTCVDAFEAAGTSCADLLYCNGAEACDVSGNCQAGSDPCPGQDCDETNDVCVSTDCDNNGTCEAGEDCNTCPNDCISGGGEAVCGDLVCQPSKGEDCVSCPSDCNGKQVGADKRQFCCGDGDGTNPVGCDDARCTSEGWACSDAPTDPYCCGDGTCEGAEDSNNCVIDCGAPPFCGDGNCDLGENQCNCAADCGTPTLNETSLCTDGMDNDCDGDTDCDDTDCYSDSVCEAVVCGDFMDKKSCNAVSGCLWDNRFKSCMDN